MDEATCLSLMKSPRDVKNCWRGMVIQIHITRACDKACFHCTQASNLAGRPVMMTPDQFLQAVLTLRDHTCVVGIFGGNPCISPFFEEICGILRDVIPFERRGLWSNNLLGKGKIVRETFNPAVSNCNVHGDIRAWIEFSDEWPAIMVTRDPNLKGLAIDSMHGAPFVAMRDVGLSMSDIYERASRCEVNQRWSPIVGVFRGNLRAWVCELMYAQAIIHENDPDWPDTGMPVVDDWWDHPMEWFAEQVRFHCQRCGMPLNSVGQGAITGTREQVSKTHVDWFKPKVPGRPVELVTSLEQLTVDGVKRCTDYIENSSLLPILP